MIQRIGEREVHNLDDYMATFAVLEPGKEVEVVVACDDGNHFGAVGVPTPFDGKQSAEEIEKEREEIKAQIEALSRRRARSRCASAGGGTERRSGDVAHRTPIRLADR